MGMRNAAQLSQLAAWAILVLLVLAPLLLVPSTVLLTARKASLAWVAWAVVSLLVALNPVRFTMLAFPERHSPQRALAISLLAVVNVVLCLGMALVPTGWMSPIR